MKRLIAKSKAVLLVVLVFALGVSAVSACACTHHEPAAVEKPSCHSSGHSAVSTEETSASTTTEITGPQFAVENSLSEPCNCYVRTTVPATISKKEDKNVFAELAAATVSEVSIDLIQRATPRVAAVNSYEPPENAYSSAHAYSLPSRAPPRL